MRARAIGQASGRAPGATRQAGKILAFITARGLELPDLRQLASAS
jgi:hypothetical protein